MGVGAVSDAFLLANNRPGTQKVLKGKNDASATLKLQVAQSRPSHL